MQASVIMLSITGKPLGEVFESVDGFGFEHYETETVQEGFDTFQEARDAYMGVANEWLENL